MSFELRAGEPIGDAVRRIVRHELDAMLMDLRAVPRRREAVHEARRSSKKLRAVVRLIRDEIGEASYRLANTTFRDAVRPLAPIRDAEVLVHSLDLLAEHFAGEIRPRAFDRLRKTLDARLRALRRTSRTPAAMRDATARVARVGSRFTRWAIRDRGWRAVEPGLRRICARASEAERCAEEDPSVEHLHEWRKRSKDLRYALELLEPIWPPVMNAFADEAHELTDRLGDDHDLAQLDLLVHADPDSCGAAEDCAALLGLIEVRRRELQVEAWSLGERLHSEKPKAFVRRLGGYWSASDREATAPAHTPASGARVDAIVLTHEAS